MPHRPKSLLIRVRLQRTRDELYAVHVGAGILPSLPGLVRALLPAHRIFLVTDSNVRRFHGQNLLALLRRAGLPAHLLAVPPGEKSKRRQVKARLEDRMLDLGGGRDSLVLALGGGMVCDLAGFVAATFHRGVPFIPIPTTLLAMVDAAIGGKTAVDHPRGKNLIGAFHQPCAVLTDVEFLATLNEREFRSGLSEVVKTAVVGDPDLFGRLERSPSTILSRHPEAMMKLVSACCRVKVRVVEADARDSGLRAVLNFGHTLGHALEHHLRYRLSHGEAVAIGMALEARAAEAARILKAGEAGRIVAVLEKLGLPTLLPKGVSPARVLETARRDKKAERGEVRYALPRKIGEMTRRRDRHTFPLPDRLVLSVLSDRS